MNYIDDGSSAAASADVSRFAGTLMEILDRVSYSHVDMNVVDNPVHRLRYEAYRREEFVPFNDLGVVVDDLDAKPNATCHGVMIDGKLVSSVRLHHLTVEHPYSPSMKVFPDILGPMLENGMTFIDPSRFTADYDASLAFPALPYLTLRLAVMSTIFHGASMCLALVRPEHTAFYRRVFGSEGLGDTRPYPGLTFPVQLFGALSEGPRYQQVFSRFPFFLSTPEERKALFGSAASEPVPATAMEAYRRAKAIAEERETEEA